MERNKALAAAALGLLVATGLTACGNGNGEGGDGATSFQQQFLESNNADVQEDPSGISIDSDTLAITGQQGSLSPVSGSPARGLEANSYYGAVDPRVNQANTFWWRWTYRNSKVDGNLPGSDFHPLSNNIGNQITAATDNTCPVGSQNGTAQFNGSGPSFPVCELNDDDTPITSDVILDNGHIYLLTEAINVGDGGDEDGPSGTNNALLTIEAGTMVMGANRPGIEGVALAITRGSQINVDGTEEMPVIMGSVAVNNANEITGDVANLNERGEWGGLVVDGMAPVNSAPTPGAAPPDGSTASEAVPDSVNRFFGGSQPADNSGKIRYLIIAESGFAFRPDQEVQGLTLEAVGSRTTANDGGPFVEYLQVLGSEDDAVEFFGGRVGVKHVVFNAQDDDGLDQDLGWQGTAQYALIRMGASNGDRGMETDGNDDDFDAEPFTDPNIANVTILGNDDRDDAPTLGAMHREGYRGDIFRSVYIDDSVTRQGRGEFDGACLDVDEMGGSTWLDNSPLTYTNVVFSCAAGSVEEPDD